MTWEFKIRGFAGSKHHNGLPFGTLLIETVHKTEASAYLEMCAWKMRLERGEVCRVELIDMRSAQRPNLTNMNVDAYTDLPWSWKKGQES